MKTLEEARRFLLNGLTGNYYTKHLFKPLGHDGTRLENVYFKNEFILRSNGQKSSILDNRELRPKNLLYTGYTHGMELLCKNLEKLGLYFVREYIFLISDEDIDLYRTTLEKSGYGLDVLQSLGYKRSWYLNYWSSDVYLPECKIIIELDSDFHRLPYIDLVRDQIIEKKYGIETYRFRDYLQNPEVYQVILDSIPRKRLPKMYLPDHLDIVANEILRDDLWIP